jgi:hypothetical protein
MTNRNWTPLIRTVANFDGEQMRISMNPAGALFLNRVAFHAMRSPEAVLLSFDETTSFIGVTPTEPGMPNALRVRKRTHGNQRAVSLVHFMTRFRLRKPKRMLHFANPTFDPDGTLVLDYRKAVNELQS